MIGKLVHTETYTSTGKSSKVLDLSDVSKGIYLINLKGKTGNITRRIVKKLNVSAFSKPAAQILV